MSKYEDDLGIDKFHLDDEIIKQAQLYGRYVELEADYAEERDNAKEKYDVVRSEVDSGIRENPDEYGFDKKPTEAAIVNLININEKTREAYQEFIAKKKDSTIITGTLVALNHKKKMLELYVQGLIAGIFADPKVNGEQQKKVSNKKQRAIIEKKKQRRIKGE